MLPLLSFIVLVSRRLSNSVLRNHPRGHFHLPGSQTSVARMKRRASYKSVNTLTWRFGGSICKSWITQEMTYLWPLMWPNPNSLILFILWGTQLNLEEHLKFRGAGSTLGIADKHTTVLQSTRKAGPRQIGTTFNVKNWRLCMGRELTKGQGLVPARDPTRVLRFSFLFLCLPSESYVLKRPSAE